MSERFTFEQLHEHTRRHGIKRWLLEGAREEDAQTIGRAVEQMSARRLARRLARLLACEATR